MFAENNKQQLGALADELVEELTEIMVRLDYRRLAAAALESEHAKQKTLERDKPTHTPKIQSSMKGSGDLFSPSFRYDVNDKDSPVSPVMRKTTFKLPGEVEENALDYDTKRTLVLSVVTYSFKLRKELNTATSVAKTKVQEYWADRIPPMVLTLGLIVLGKLYLDVLSIKNDTGEDRVNVIISAALTVLGFIFAFYMIFLRLPHAVDGATKQKASDFYQTQKDPLGRLITELSTSNYYKDQVAECFVKAKEHIVETMQKRFSAGEYDLFHEGSVRNHASKSAVAMTGALPSNISSSHSSVEDASRTEEERLHRREERDYDMRQIMDEAGIKDDDFGTTAYGNGTQANANGPAGSPVVEEEEQREVSIVMTPTPTTVNEPFPDPPIVEA
ncbi:hypothetical protein DIPPA_06755 [Diplonema papillatum]|nr:hypothetical protein DIPPA_06755 [Diplonema papillatum]